MQKGYRTDMLPGCNNNKLLSKRVNPELVFLYQRWQELLETRTLDMYQYNILNAFLACIELQDVIDKTLNGLLSARQNVVDVMNEALEIMKSDDILKKYDNSTWITLMRILSSQIGKKGKDEQESDFKVSLFRLKHQLSRPCSILKGEYTKYIVDELKEDIRQQNKHQMDRHLSVLISQCIHQGWSTKGLFNLSFKLEGDCTLDSKLQRFFTPILSPATNCFEIYHSIRITTRPGLSSTAVKLTIQSLGIDLKKGVEIITSDSERQGLYNLLDPDKYYAIIIGNTFDIHTAVLSAINTLQSKLSIATFYNTIDPFIASSPNIIAYDTATNRGLSLKITDIFKTYDYVDTANNVFESTKNLFNDDNHNDTMSRLSSAFLYTNLSRSSPFQETKFITLWIALESIMRTGQYSDIISHVKKVLPSALCVRYFYKLMRNFAEDCIRCGIERLDSPLDINLKHANKEEVVTSLISVFREQSKFDLLYQQCTRNELLCYRCQELKEIFCDCNVMKQKLDHYKTKVQWHIQRLYRIRNEITHSAFHNDRSLVIYIEHMYTYLSQLISEIVFYLAHKEAKSIEDAYACLEHNYLTFMDIIDPKHQTVPTINEVVPKGVIDII